MSMDNNQLAAPMFAKVPYAAAELTLLDMRVQYEDGDSTDAIASAKVIQGLVNRNGPNKLYLFNDCTDDTHNIGGKLWNVQKEWLEQTDELRGLPQHTLHRANGRNGGLHVLLQQYEQLIKGFVIWDSNTHNKVNMATFGAAVTIASQKSGVAVSPEVFAEIRSWGFDMPVLEDLRAYKFQSDHEAMDWSIDHYWEGSNHELRAVFSLGMDGWAPITEWADNWLSNTIFNEGPIDYAVSTNGFSFNINMMDGNDDYVLMKLLRKYPEGRTALLGWVPTHPFVYGFSEMPTCLNLTSYFVVGVNGFSNLSVFASFPDSQAQLPKPAAPEVQDNSVFINFLATDGDALHCVYRGVFSAFTTRKTEDFGVIPMTWTISPILANLAPPVYNYFVKNLPAGSDYALAWANKVQTVYDTGLDEMLDNIRQYAKLADLRINWTVHSSEDTQKADQADWESIVIGYSNSRVSPRVSSLNANTAVIGTWCWGELSPEEIISGIREAVNERQEGPIFMSVVLGASFDISGGFYTNAKIIADALLNDPQGQRYKFVNAGDMAEAYKVYARDMEK